MGFNSGFNSLNPELNPICYLLALLGAHHFLHVSRIRVKGLTSALDEFASQRHAPVALPTGKGPSTHCVEGSVGPRACLDWSGKSRPHQDSIPGPSSL